MENETSVGVEIVEFGFKGFVYEPTVVRLCEEIECIRISILTDDLSFQVSLCVEGSDTDCQRRDVQRRQSDTAIYTPCNVLRVTS